MNKHLHTDKYKPRTGDLILCNGATLTSFVLKTATSADWNHCGVAIRVDKHGNIVLTDEGDLYVLEINTQERIQKSKGIEIKGASLSSYDWIKKTYSTTAIRKLNNKYRTKEFLDNVLQFLKNHAGYSFPSHSTPFLSVFLSAYLGRISDIGRKRNMFCSEFICYFYLFCLNKTLLEIVGVDTIPQLIHPGHFSSKNKKYSTVFDSDDIIIHKRESNILILLFPIIILTLFLLIIIDITLRFSGHVNII